MKRETTRKTSCFAIALITALCAAQAWGEDAYVYVRNSGFSPASVSINVGETVWFIVADDNDHCIQSETGAWTPWYLWGYGDGFGITFNQKGDYYYRDGYTWTRGVVHVGTTVVNLPPTVTITSPQEGAVFTEPADFQFSAIAADPDGAISAVEFYVGSTLVDVLYDGVFSTHVTNLVAGSYSLSITAWDTGAATTTKSVNITVEPPGPVSIRLSPPSIVAGEFHFEAAGLTVGKQVVLQSAPSLDSSATWTSLQTNDITAATMPFSQPMLPGACYFRVVQLP